MPEDFLKKINSKKEQGEENPFDKLFQSKKSEIKPATAPEREKKEDAPNSMEGIENLGKSPTSKERYVETPQAEETKPVKTEQVNSSAIESEDNDDAGGLELEVQPKGLAPSESKIPAKSLENADIFSAPQHHGNFLSNVSSSTNDLSFDEEAHNAQNAEIVIMQVSELLRKKKKDEAVKLINDKF